MVPYVAIAVLFVLSTGVAIMIMMVGSLFGPRHPTPRKLMPYESGMVPIGRAMQRMPIRFYLIATLFIIFDIEVIFLFPWALVYRQLGVFGLLEMFVFLALLVAGFVYVWRKGALEWE
ncbi:MAG: NADH-quinone oxidoreductase subunit A [Ardenticatenia bacterium]|nr:NADH-quinone oxidoreductase subunit A [Ardenticatenia bacterium]